MIRRTPMRPYAAIFGESVGTGRIGVDRPRWRAALVLLLLPICVVCAEDKPSSGPNVLVVADAMTTEGEAFQPAPGKPVYYYVLDGKQRAIGHSYAGEKFPSREAIVDEVVKVLATHGYVRTQKGGPVPSLGVLILWGTANAMIDDIPGEQGGSVMYNRREMRQVAGADKADSHHGNDPQENEQIDRHLNEYRVYVMVGAFDAAALKKKEKKLVWRTTMSIDTLISSFPESIAAMVTSAAPYFGRSTEKAVSVTDADRRNATVKLGPLQVIEMGPATEKPDRK